MSLKVLIEDQTKKLFTDSPELKNVNKNEFEIAVANFCNVKILNGLEVDDLIDGILGNGGDEGIDMCYILCNGLIVKNENHQFNADSTIKVKFFQVKKEDSFTVNGFKNLKEGIEEIFSLDMDTAMLKKIGANEELIKKAELIRRIFRRSQTEQAKFLCEVYYITVSAEVNIPPKITEIYELDLKNNPLSIPFKFEYWGGQKLLEMTKRFDENLELKFDGQRLEILDKGIETSGFAGFVKGNDLMNSLIDNEGNFKSHLTEGNIRYFLGVDKVINKSIVESAFDKTKAVVFWAMNNGITILGDNISPLSSQEFTILNPQIVNGCQTVHCLYDAYTKGKNSLPDNLKVFIKLVQTKDINKQTDIISATNSQNPVKVASLKANDSIQRNICKSR